VDFRDIAHEVVVSGCATAAPPGVGLLSDHDARAESCRTNPRHEPGDSPAHDQYVGFDWFAINIDHFHSLPFDFNRRGAEHAEREFFSQWRRDTAIEKYSAAARGCSYLFGETY
jgi:hypothetical protein